jgi:arsenical resistance operon trans-acting repressor ArsD
MPHLEVFDPPLCCASGVCGPAVDPLLAAFAADVEWLVSHGVTVARHNLAQDPQAFVAEPSVRDLLHRDGDACLPLVIMNGAVVARGAYPRRDDLARFAGLQAGPSPTKARIRLASASCCKPGSGCC